MCVCLCVCVCVHICVCVCVCTCVRTYVCEQNTSFILFLNKKDLFADKIKTVPFNSWKGAGVCTPACLALVNLIRRCICACMCEFISVCECVNL